MKNKVQRILLIKISHPANSLMLHMFRLEIYLFADLLNALRFWSAQQIDTLHAI